MNRDDLLKAAGSYEGVGDEELTVDPLGNRSEEWLRERRAEIARSAQEYEHRVEQARERALAKAWASLVGWMKWAALMGMVLGCIGGGFGAVVHNLQQPRQPQAWSTNLPERLRRLQLKAACEEQGGQWIEKLRKGAFLSDYAEYECRGVLPVWLRNMEEQPHR